MLINRFGFGRGTTFRFVFAYYMEWDGGGICGLVRFSRQGV